MSSAASSSAPTNVPFRWRRKPYMKPNHTIAGYNSESVDGASGPSTPAPVDSTTDSSTGSCALKVQKDKVDASVQTDSVEVSTDGNNQELAPTLTSAISPLPPMVTPHAFNCEQLTRKLGFMQKRMEGWNICREPAEKENMALPSRPLKRKRAAPRTTPVAPVRQSKRLMRKVQGGDKE